MKVLVLASSLRTAGNFQPVIERLRARGDTVDLAWVPLGGARGEDPSVLGFGQVYRAHMHARTDSGPFWDGIATVMEGFCDLVLMDDMIHWPAQELAARVRRLTDAPPLVAFQHGLHQAWNLMNREFLADFFLCFGRRHVMNFDQAHWARVLPVGLPKLDVLQPAAPGGREILFVAQSAPDASIIGPLLADLEQATGLRVRIRAHPGHVGRYASLQSRFECADPSEPIEEQIRRAAWMLTTHSSAVLEAMRLGIDAVVLPSFGLTDFTFYPGIAVDFRADKVLHALGVLRRDGAARQRFMDEHCCGMRRDATARALVAIDAIVAGARDGNGEARRALVASMGRDHPLNGLSEAIPA